MSPGVRKLALTAHVASSVGWLGAVVAFLPPAVTGLISQDVETVRATYQAMELIGWYALVPLALASLLTGLVQSLGTRWGLFRHYWVLFKLVIAAASTLILLSYMQTLGLMADTAAQEALSSAELRTLRSPTAVLHAGLAVMALLVNTTLSVYKPRGLTPYGQRMQREEGEGGSTAPTPPWVKVFGIIALVLCFLLTLRLLARHGDHGPGRHLSTVEVHLHPSPGHGALSIRLETSAARESVACTVQVSAARSAATSVSSRSISRPSAASGTSAAD